MLMWVLFTACTSNSNKPADDLDKAAAEQQATPHPARNILSATEFIALSACSDLSCVQLFMKDHSTDFVHAKKGEFASLYRLAVTDTTGEILDIPMSTLYVTVDAGADWRMAHTLHNKALSDQLLQEFAAENFLLSDSLYSKKMQGITIITAPTNTQVCFCLNSKHLNRGMQEACIIPLPGLVMFLNYLQWNKIEPHKCWLG